MPASDLSIWAISIKLTSGIVPIMLLMMLFNAVELRGAVLPRRLWLRFADICRRRHFRYRSTVSC